MIKGLRKTLPAVSLLLFFLASCTIPPTYTRKNIKEAIQDVCWNEFNIKARAALTGDTIWIYAPFKKLVTEDGQWEEKSLKDIRQIFHSLSRILLSMDNPPKFYCLLAADIERVGIDTYTIGFIPDLIKFDMGFISMKERDERIAFFSFPNPKALGDTEGNHMQEYDISPDEFAGYLK
ncbi:MAG: hypothetical protein KAT96_01365 [Candidatus Omnitrophica bacterium]|nr:hypothetical protein [Candidatus Omnitrophota bacterium]